MHEFHVSTEWTGAGDAGTADYRSYERSYDVAMPGKPGFEGSAAAPYRGDAAKPNPEDMVVASASACHMLSYLHLCAVNKVVVLAYSDDAIGLLEVNKQGSGEFSEIVLRPKVTISVDSDIEVARTLHTPASENCFIARSLKCPVTHKAEIQTRG